MRSRPSLFCSFLTASLLAALLVLPAQAQHPTAVTSVVNAARDTTLEVNYSGGLLMPGKLDDPTNYTSPNDSIQAEGAGTRLIWYPEKAAFRAGRVGNVSGKEDVWDASNIGSYSVSFGVDTKASGKAGVALGEETTASGGHATAMGLGTTAGGAWATAMGRLTTASGIGATAMGFASTARGNFAIAMGSGTTANGENATAMGNNTEADARYATAMGEGTTASAQDATVMGEGTTASSGQSFTLGECNIANTSADGSLLVVGNGTYTPSICDNRSDALVLDRSGNLEISGTLTENSDRRLKTDIAPVDSNVLQKLSRLRPIRFQFKDQTTHPSGKQIGLIAQDVQKEFPSLVSEGSDGMLSLAYPKMTAVLLKGIQEQQSKIEEQNERIDRLEKRLATLEAKQQGTLPAGLVGPWTFGLLLGLGGLATGMLWRRW